MLLDLLTLSSMCTGLKDQKQTDQSMLCLLLFDPLTLLMTFALIFVAGVRGFRRRLPVGRVPQLPRPRWRA